MSDEAVALYELGVRVILCGSHSHAGQEGTLWVSPGLVFNGWTVKLDSGHYVGASQAQMVSERQGVLEEPPA